MICRDCGAAMATPGRTLCAFCRTCREGGGPGVVLGAYLIVLAALYALAVVYILVAAHVLVAAVTR